VVETTKKMSRIVRISTSETIMMEGARRFRTAIFMMRKRPRRYLVGALAGTAAGATARGEFESPLATRP
jgi:hypothetical protein